MIKYIIASLLLWLGLFGVAVFLSAIPNPFDWIVEGRFVFVLFGVCLNAFLIGFLGATND